jgi:hypothetical protein
MSTISKGKGKGKVVIVRVIKKEQTESRGLSPSILNNYSLMELSDQLHAPATSLRVKYRGTP